MPICPGCERTIPYERLDVHQRYCEGIWNDDRRGVRSIELLERRLSAMEARLDRRLREFEEDIDRQLSVVDVSRGATRESRRRK